MKIIYNNNIDTTNICFTQLADANIGNKKNIVRTIINNKYYVVKINNNKYEAKISGEISKKIIDMDERFLFIKIYSIIECDDKIMYFMEDIKFKELKYMLGLLNKQWKIYFLLQSLIAIYVLNHNLGYYHNDLFFKTEIRNVMIDDIYYKERNIEKYNFENLFTIPINTYCVKIIDFEWINKEPKLRTLEYHDKYFKKSKYVSEIAIFIYFYFLTVKKDVLKSLLQRIEKIEKIVDNRRDFDKKLIEEMYNLYSKYL
jgi:hypothetical protein